MQSVGLFCLQGSKKRSGLFLYFGCLHVLFCKYKCVKISNLNSVRIQAYLGMVAFSSASSQCAGKFSIFAISLHLGSFLVAFQVL